MSSEKEEFKKAANKSYQKFMSKKSLWKWGVGGAITIAAAGIIIPLAVKTGDNSTNIDLKNVLIADSLIKDDTQLPVQHFVLINSNDTVLETKEGIVFALSKESFVDENGKTLEGAIDVVIKEALGAEAIMTSGLSTTSNGELLETAGMFYVSAFADGKELKINPKKPIHAQVPTNEIKPGMKLFSGERLSNGQINWVNPVELEKYLVPVEITSLNFYPPNYENKLAELGYGEKSKKWKDSLYYSFGEKTEMISGEKVFKANCSPCHNMDKPSSGPALKDVAKRVQPGKYGTVENWLKEFTKNNNKVIASGDPYANKVYNENGKGAMTIFERLPKNHLNALIKYITSNGSVRESEEIVEQGDVGQKDFVNPAKIQTIWNAKFNNTLLATKEFEERLKVIFSTCDNSILELYINNIQKNMYEIDEMAYAKSGNYKFKEFAERKDGKVKTNDAFAKSLSTYYEQQSKKNQEAVTALRNKYYQKQNELNQQFNNKQNKQAQKEAEIAANNFNKEFTKNLEETYKQLGFKKAEPQNYKATITTTGWKNIDAYVLEATVTRTTTNITYNGKTATITYKPFGVEVADKASYDRIYAYLLADGLYSFQRINEQDAGFTEKLNSFFTYRLVVVGYKGEQAYLFQQDVLSKDGGKIIADMKTVSANELKSALNQHNKMSKDVIEDLHFEKIKVENEKRVKENMKMEEMREKLWPVIAPCDIEAAATAFNSEYYWAAYSDYKSFFLFDEGLFEEWQVPENDLKNRTKISKKYTAPWNFSENKKGIYVDGKLIPITWINKNSFSMKERGESSNTYIFNRMQYGMK